MGAVVENVRYLTTAYKWLSKKLPFLPPISPFFRVHSLLMRLDTNEGIQRGMAQGVYEPEQTAWLKACLSPGDRFVDLGANFGWYTALASTILKKSGHVFAFEPSPIANGVIANTIEENHLNNVTLIRAAVGDADGQVQIYLPVNDSVHSPSIFFSDPQFIPLQVPLISLDNYGPFVDGRPINLIKMDVEGYEPNVIRGMRYLIRRGLVKNIFCEFNSGWLKPNSTTPAELFELITSYGFVVHKKTELQMGYQPDGQLFECQDMWFKWLKSDRD